MKVPIHPVHWKSGWRAIPTLYPSENLLKRVTDPKDIPAIEELDGLTNARMRLERGEINYLPKGEKIDGATHRYISASFSYSLNKKSRFGDGTYGLYYAASSLMTSIVETVFHREKFMRATKQNAMMLPMRVIVSHINGKLHDLRGLKQKHPAIYSSSSYVQSQKLGQELWDAGSNGIVYDSVRHTKGECAAIFKPSVLSHCRDERVLLYEWDGNKIKRVHELQEFPDFK